MLRRLFKSVYFKAAATILISGAVLILFRNWVSATNFASGLSTLNSTLMPIYIGCGIAFIMCPIYNKMVGGFYAYFSGNYNNVPRHWKRRESDTTASGRRRALTAARTIASILTFVIIIGAVFLFGYAVLPQLIENIVNLINTLPERMEALVAWSEKNLTQFPQVQGAINSLANTGSAEAIDWIQTHILQNSSNFTDLAQFISSSVMTFVVAIKNVFIGLLISLYLLNYKEKLFAIGRKLISSTISDRRAKGIYEFCSTINETFISFIVGRILDALVIGVLTYVVLRISGIKMALLIGVIVGVTNVIPFFGPFLGAIPSFILVLIDSPIKALWFLVIIVVIQQLDGNFIGPKIVGTAIGLPSFWVLIAVLVGGGLFGVLGMFLGTPVFAVIYKYVDKGARRRLGRKDKPLDTDDYYDLNSYNIKRDEILGDDEVPEDATE